MADIKKIAFVANTSWSIYKFRLYLIQQLIAKSYQIIVLAPYDKYAEFFKDLPSITFIPISHFESKNLSPLKDIQLFRELAGHYKALKPDLIFHYTIKANIFGSLAAARCGISSVSVITGLGYAFLGNSFLKGAAKFLYKRSLKKNAEVWFLNKDDQLTFIEAGLVSASRTFLLPGEGIDTDLFTASPYTEKQVVTFLVIARLIKHKGIYEYVEAARILKAKGLQARFQLLGFFEDKSPIAITQNHVEQWASQNLIDYLGQTDDVVPFIEQADCIVLPSYREGMPLSLLEGASMCKALIATDTPGCREIISDGVNGYLCHKKDSANLAQKMEQYYDLPAAEKIRMGMSGRQKVLRQFKKEIITALYVQKTEQLLRQ